jgi:DNA polymerase III delta subunit
MKRFHLQAQGKIPPNFILRGNEKVKIEKACSILSRTYNKQEQDKNIWFNSLHGFMNSSHI